MCMLYCLMFFLQYTRIPCIQLRVCYVFLLKSVSPYSRNKCHNEKKRRELENETINQLEELLGTCLAEVKQPDKNGIVREATRQIQEVLKRRRECPGECPLRAVQCLSPVQAGEVSSTQPQPSGRQYSELTALIEVQLAFTSVDSATLDFTSVRRLTLENIVESTCLFILWVML